jgi:Anti-sigma factor NepR
VANNKQPNRKPAIDRYSQDRIGRELRATYQPFVEEPLPETFLGLLRAWENAEASRYCLKQAIDILRANSGFELNERSSSAHPVHAQQTLVAQAFGARGTTTRSLTSDGLGRQKGRKVATSLLYARRRTS